MFSYGGEGRRGRLSASAECPEGPGPSDVPRSSFLHAGGFGFGDVLVVGLVLQLPAEVLDCFIQAFLQRHLQTHKRAHQETGAAVRPGTPGCRQQVNRYEAATGPPRLGHRYR